jgi:diguanylate cyclase (GGDEF)-like protein
VTLGRVGWLIVPAMALTWLAKVALVRRVEGARVFDVLLASAYVITAELGAIQWLAGGWRGPYHVLFLAVLLVVVLTHPRPRALPYALFNVALALSPLAYGETHGRAGDVGMAAVLWLGMTLFCTSIMALLRAQRTLLIAVRDAAEDDARHDQLTGLENRRSFVETVDAALARSRSAGRPLTLAVGDVDRFKGINDRHGHLAGDRCLQAVAGALSAATRGDDRVFRWGGDEFAVLLEGLSTAEAAIVCSRIERQVRDAVRTPDGTAVGVTFGWARDDGAGSADALMAHADAALLARKRARPRLVA